MRQSYLVKKRMFDLVCATVGVLLASPLFLLIWLWIKLDSRGPIFFRQRRVGLNGRHFWICKFRTMVHDAPRRGKEITVSGDPRITRAGRFLRKYKLDELPQLFNVIRGEMSLVGPRPEVPRYVELYDQQQKQVLSMLPGVTDEASIRYRNENELLGGREDAEKIYIEVVMPDKLRLNLAYMEEASMKKDIAILFRTLLAIAGLDKKSHEELGRR
jgi:lipopolysaccharide/colanic/teichoic acid biosynthesis glycosyltransferase